MAMSQSTEIRPVIVQLFLLFISFENDQVEKNNEIQNTVCSKQNCAIVTFNVMRVECTA